MIASSLVSWLRGGRSERANAYEQRRARDREIMLQRVRYRWITGVLEPSLAQPARSRIGMTIRRAGHPPEPVPAGTPVSAMFDQISGGLLILGAPGSGKTTVLLELARDLLDRAEADQAQPMPVVLNLSSWAQQQPPFVEWLIGELRARYGVPTLIARLWVGAGQILPLLDGLDEVAPAYRAKCAEAISAFHQEHRARRFAVCSRTGEYTALAARLRVEEALELQPLTRGQVIASLDAAGSALAGVRAAVDADEDLCEFLKSPLALSIVALTYCERPAGALRAAGTREERLARLLTAYAERMLEDRPGRHAPGRMSHWLAWLARSLREHSETEFHLERLPQGWLPTVTQRRLMVLIPAIGVGSIAGLCAGLFAGPGFGLLAGAILGLLTGRTREEPVAEVHWSWLKPRSHLAPVLVGGLLVGWLAGLLGGLPVGAVFTLVAWLAAGLVGGLFTRLGDEPPTPDEGIRRAARYALVFGVFAGLVLGLLTGLLFGLGAWLAGGLAGGPLAGLLAGIAFGMVAGLIIGGATCLRRLALRGLLAWSGFAPVRYARFLDDATERLILRRTGNGYLFAHRLLLEHFAAQSGRPAPRARRKRATASSRPAIGSG